MDFENFTPFPVLCFDSIGPSDTEHHVIAIRATFQVHPDKTLIPADIQAPIRTEDFYYGAPGQSSLRFPSDLAPFKPNADIIVNATAYPPEGKPQKAWLVSVQVGTHRKELCVTGPRRWKKSFWTGWHLSFPRPVEKLPLLYEHAYGGSVSVPLDEGEETVLAFHGNPTGKGYWPSAAAKLVADVNEVEAPQIVARKDLFPSFRNSCSPDGFGAIAPGWQQRKQFAGLITTEWLAEGGHSLLPGFDYRFYNAAHPDLQVPYLLGDEAVELTNLTPEGYLKFQLPDYTVFVVGYYDGAELLLPTLLDTLLIEPDEMQATLVWRTVIPTVPVVDRLEVRCTIGDDAQEEGRDA